MAICQKYLPSDLSKVGRVLSNDILKMHWSEKSNNSCPIIRCRVSHSGASATHHYSERRPTNLPFLREGVPDGAKVGQRFCPDGLYAIQKTFLLSAGFNNSIIRLP